VQLGVFVGHGPQLIEHGGHIPRHADLVGLGVVSFGPRFLCLVACGIEFFAQGAGTGFQITD
jgi:hypothetical protein